MAQAASSHSSLLPTKYISEMPGSGSREGMKRTWLEPSCPALPQSASGHSFNSSPSVLLTELYGLLGASQKLRSFFHSPSNLAPAVKTEHRLMAEAGQGKSGHMKLVHRDVISPLGKLLPPSQFL